MFFDWRHSYSWSFFSLLSFSCSFNNTVQSDPLTGKRNTVKKILRRQQESERDSKRAREREKERDEQRKNHDAIEMIVALFLWYTKRNVALCLIEWQYESGLVKFRASCHAALQSASYHKYITFFPWRHTSIYTNASCRNNFTSFTNKIYDAKFKCIKRKERKKINAFLCICAVNLCLWWLHFLFGVSWVSFFFVFFLWIIWKCIRARSVR